MKKCEKCNEIVEDDKNFCPTCGANFIQKRSGKLTAAGIMLLISAALSLVAGIYCIIMIILGVQSFNQQDFYTYQNMYSIMILYFFLATIIYIIAFALGLAGGIYSFKRIHFSIAIIGVSFVITAACVGFIVIFISIPNLILGILSTIFIATAKKEFT
jgi:RNA polymerase subunit RPABC4/transcription elongation factor Spt4